MTRCHSICDVSLPLSLVCYAPIIFRQCYFPALLIACLVYQLSVYRRPLQPSQNIQHEHETFRNVGFADDAAWDAEPTREKKTVRFDSSSMVPKSTGESGAGTFSKYK